MKAIPDFASNGRDRCIVPVYDEQEKGISNLLSGSSGRRIKTKNVIPAMASQRPESDFIYKVTFPKGTRWRSGWRQGAKQHSAQLDCVEETGNGFSRITTEAAINICKGGRKQKGRPLQSPPQEGDIRENGASG